MLRITVHDDTEPMAVLLEGKLSGDWVRELREEWGRLRALRRDRILVVILTGLSFVDAEGRRLLVEIYSSGCVLTGSGLFARDLREKIERKPSPGPASVDAPPSPSGEGPLSPRERVARSAG